LFTVGYKKSYGSDFNPKTAMKEMAKREKISKVWNSLDSKITKLYSTAKKSARTFNKDIDMYTPRFNIKLFRVEFKHDEPRSMRHPSEYGGTPEQESGYETYMDAIDALTTELEKFTKKFKLEFLHAADWS
jgi:hypothetical protein